MDSRIRAEFKHKDTQAVRSAAEPVQWCLHEHDTVFFLLVKQVREEKLRHWVCLKSVAPRPLSLGTSEGLSVRLGQFPSGHVSFDGTLTVPCCGPKWPRERSSNPCRRVTAKDAEVQGGD